VNRPYLIVFLLFFSFPILPLFIIFDFLHIITKQKFYHLWNYLSLSPDPLFSTKKTTIFSTTTNTQFQFHQQQQCFPTLNSSNNNLNIRIFINLLLLTFIFINLKNKNPKLNVDKTHKSKSYHTHNLQRLNWTRGNNIDNIWNSREIAQKG